VMMAMLFTLEERLLHQQTHPWLSAVHYTHLDKAVCRPHLVG
jgi:hypothetical protein